MGRTSLGEELLQRFVQLYGDTQDKTYLVNYGMIVMANRVAKFYTKPQLKKALDAFFASKRKKDFYTFVDNIDKLVVEYDKKKESEKEFEDLEKKTTRLVKRIHKKRVGKKT